MEVLDVLDWWWAPQLKANTVDFVLPLSHRLVHFPNLLPNTYHHPPISLKL